MRSFSVSISPFAMAPPCLRSTRLAVHVPSQGRAHRTDTRPAVRRCCYSSAMALSFLAFAGALRKGSYNRKLCALAAEQAEARGAAVDRLDLHDLALPLYDGDVETSSGLPPGAVEMRRRIVA